MSMALKLGQSQATRVAKADGVETHLMPARTATIKGKRLQDTGICSGGAIVSRRFGRASLMTCPRTRAKDRPQIPDGAAVSPLSGREPFPRSCGKV